MGRPAAPADGSGAMLFLQLLSKIDNNLPLPYSSCATTPGASTMTLNVNLTPVLEEMVRKKVAGGLYNNASEVIRDALRLMEAHDRLQLAQMQALRLSALQDDLREGIASGSAGELDIKAIKRRGRTKLKHSPR